MAKNDPFLQPKPSILGIRKQNRTQMGHSEPDPDDMGGASDNDADDKQMASLRKMLATKRKVRKAK